MKYDYDLVVIGAGSGGLVAASSSASLGAKVAIIESHKMGGDCLNYGCVPSKTFLKSAHLLKDIRSSGEYGINIDKVEVDISKIMGRVRRIISEIEPHDSRERYESMGVDVFFGHGYLKNSHTVCIKDNHMEKNITANNILISTGSSPKIPDINGLDKIEYYTNENIFDIDNLPKHIVVIGGGPIGLELGQGFRHLGSQVSIIDRNPTLFKKDDKEVSPIMTTILKRDGINLHLNSVVERLKKENGDIIVDISTHNGDKKSLNCDCVLVSMGRTPNSSGLNLESVGVKIDSSKRIITDSTLRTNIKNIFACGDVSGPYNFTHTAGYQGSIVSTNALFKLRRKQSFDNIAWTTYTKPEVAHVGLTEQDAIKSSLFERSIIIDMNSNDRAKAEGDTDGFLKIIVGKNGKVIGATLVSDHAGEMITMASIAISRKLKPSSFLNIMLSYPTEVEIFKSAAISDLKNSIKPWHITLSKKVISLLGRNFS